MSEFGIIALSILVGMFALTLVLTSVGLVWFMLRVQKLIANLETLLTTTQTSLDSRISAINGDDLKKAVERLGILIRTMTNNVRDNERAALAMGEIYQRIFSEEEMAKNKLPPEAYAEPDAEGGRFVDQSDAAKRDAGTLDDM